ncbi:MAG: alanine racemase [Acidiferrobacterales bacterium]
MSRPLRAVIHTQSLQHNLARVREFAPSSKVMAVIKADGYGHGIATVANALTEADALAVASIDEALLIKESAPDSPPICLLEGVFRIDELNEVFNSGLVLVIHNEEQVRYLESSKTDNPVPVWLKIDTGMNRLGIDVNSFQDLYQRLQSCEAVSQIGLMTHFACADDAQSPKTVSQLKKFEQAIEGTTAARSAANSAGIVQWPDSYYEWVRPGIMLYGSSPVLGQSADELGLKPVMSLESELVALHQVKKGDTVGYGATWIAERDTTIGVVACGYGDGYPRHARSGTPVLVNNQRQSLVGRVSMDMITVDVGDQPRAKIGDPVVLWGAGLSVDEIAASADTISYELLCQVTRRVEREVV